MKEREEERRRESSGTGRAGERAAPERAAPGDGGGLSRSCLVRGAVALALLMIVGAGLAWWFWTQRPSLSEQQVRRAVVSTIQREAKSSFYVTGRLQTTVTSTITNDKIFLPGVWDLNVGTTETRARVPGTIHYGFEVGQLRAEDIHVAGDTVTVTLPPLQVHSVEPDLRQMQLKTTAGWTRFYDDSRSSTRQAALRLSQEALREQGRQHLRDSDQPRRNTAEAMGTMLRPVLEAMGTEDPVLRFRAGDEQGDGPVLRAPTG